MKVVKSVTGPSPAESLKYYVKPSESAGIFVATVGGKLALGNALYVYGMEGLASVVATRRQKLLERHLAPDSVSAGRFLVGDCGVDIETIFEGSPHSHRGVAQIDSSYIYEIAPPPGDQHRMN